LSLAAWVRLEGLNYWLSALMLTDGWDLGEPHWEITADRTENPAVHFTSAA